MQEENVLSRISVNPKIMGGKPVIRGTRLTVQYILKALADGTSIEELLDEYKGLTHEDISACLLYAAKTVDNVAFFPVIEETSE